MVSKDKNDQALYEIKRIHHNKIDGWDYLYLKNSMYKNSGERGDYADKYTLATPEEIKAGHRIDDNTDHVTDIRNHVSPSTGVVDL